MTDATAMLPPEFADLEPFAGWALPTETARNHKRIDAPQSEIDAFAAAAIPRLDAICVYLDRFPLDALRRFGTMATPEVAVVCDLPGPRAPAELWRLALEWRVRPERLGTGYLWSLA